MPVIAVTEDFEGRQAEYSFEGRKYTRVYNVRTNDVADCGPTIFNAVGIPALGIVFPTDAWAYLISKQARQGEDANWWQVSCEYNTKLPFEPDELDENPLNRPAQIRVSTNKFTKIITEDVSGTKLLNSAGVPFADGYEVADSRPVYSISWNEDVTGFDVQDFLEFQNCINSDTWRGFAIGTALVSDVSLEFAYENGVAFYKLQVQIEYNKSGWNPIKILDKGKHKKKVGGSPPYEVIREAGSGSPVSEEVLLDGNGNPLPQGGTPQYRSFTVYESKTFAGTLP